MTSGPVDAWASADAYERYVGRWSRPVAEEFLAWLDVRRGAAWLDVGCGTGALSDTILRCAEPVRVEGVDPAEAYVEQAQRTLAGPRSSFSLGRAERLKEPPDAFDAVVSGLALNFVPTPEAAVAEMARVTRHGGVVAAYVWDYGGDMQLMRYFWNAAVAINPEAAWLDEARRFPMCRPDRLEALFRGAGLNAVVSRAIDIQTRFSDFDDYWSPFLDGQGPAPGYAKELSEHHRDQLRETIRRALPVGVDGSIELVARAWAVRGIKGGEER